MTSNAGDLAMAPASAAADSELKNEAYVFDCSYGQQRLWFLDRLEPGRPIYNMPLVLRLRGALIVSALEAALQTLVARHESLRTRFATVDGHPVQVVDTLSEWVLEHLDLSGMPPGKRDAAWRRAVSDEARRGFELTTGPLFRGRLLVLGERDHVLALTLHHIIADGWSLSVLLRELTASYPVFAAGQAYEQGELPLQYADYAHWQLDWLQGDELESQLSYWRDRLGGELPVLELPHDRPRPPLPEHRGGMLRRTLPDDLRRDLEILARQCGVTLFMALLGGFKILLARYTGETDVLVGTTVAGRNQSELEGLIGFFVNTLVLRTDLGGSPTVRAVLERVKATTLGAYAHQDLPFERLVDALQPERDLSHPPLFQVLFSYYAAPERDLRLGDLDVEVRDSDTGTARVDLTVQVEDGADGRLRLQCEYSSDLFAARTIERLLGHWQRLLGVMTAQPDTPIDRLPLLAPDERRKLLLHDWNATAAPVSTGCIHDRFAAQVAAHPQRVALISERETMSYGELDSRANRLAHRLRASGAGPDTIVGVHLHRGTNLLVALLGVLKAGGAYLPLEPEQPRERLGLMLADSGATLVVSHGSIAEGLPEANVEVICLDRDWPRIADYPSTSPAVRVSPDRLAYVIYTSGSTGRPKGTMLAHAGVVNRLLWQAESQDLDEGDCFLQKTPFGFDVSVWELFLPLMLGARLVLARPEGHKDPAYLQGLMQEQGVSVVHFVPSMLAAFLQHGIMADLGALRCVICSGEALPASLAESFHRRFDARLENLYGPTEASIDITAWSCLADSGRASVPIGRPIANTQVYILDNRLEPVPSGVAGELYLGGVGLARGYLARPALTAERFVPDPFGAQSGARLYRSGDLARWSADGQVEFLGRLDHQVKLRGFRIELGEVEAALLAQPAVHEAVAAAQRDAHGHQHLVAYIVADTELDTLRLRHDLHQRLPEYMVPGTVMRLERLPLTPNGKIDRKALPRPSVEQDSNGVPYVAPRTATEIALAALWTELLGVARVGVEDNFFHLGGHSLGAARLQARIRESLHAELPLRELFEFPVLGEQAAAVADAARVGGSGDLLPVARDGDLPLSYVQQRLWFLDRLEPGQAVYNIPLAVRMEGALDHAALTRALNDLIARHEILRTTFAERAGAPVQQIADQANLALPVDDLTALPSTEREAAMQARLGGEARGAFDLSTAPLLRARLLRLDDQAHVLALTLHHIIADGWSLGVLVTDLAALYAAAHADRAPELKPLAVQYADYAYWQRAWLEHEEEARQLDYWCARLAGDIPVLELPTDHPRPAVQSYRGTVLRRSLDPDLVTELEAMSVAEGVTLFMLLLAGFKVLLWRYSGQTDVLVGTPVAGRGRVALEGLIGCFINTLVLRTDLSGAPTVRDLLMRVKATAAGAFAHQDLPFERLVDVLRPERDLSHAPLFQVLFTLHNEPHPDPYLDGLRMRLVDTSTDTAKFDLSLHLEWTTEGRLGVSAEFAADLFEARTIERLLDHWQRLLGAMTAQPDTPIDRLPLLASDERRELLGVDRVRDPLAGLADPALATLHGLVGARTATAPDAVALEWGAQQITYAELDARAEALARVLRARGVGPEVRVGVCLRRTPRLLQALLGILKAGGAYVPLDPAYPRERIDYMLADSNAALLLSERAIAERLPQTSTLAPLWLDQPLPAAEPGPFDAAAAPENLAYIIYTSGSTGRPKGVAIAHRNAAALLHWARATYSDADLAGVLASTSICFDLSVFELFVPLAWGGRVILADNALALPELPAAERVTLLNTVPSAMTELLRGGGLATALRVVNLAGEPLKNALVQAVYANSPARRVCNLYGPSEDTTYTTYLHVARGAQREPGIGRPVAGTWIYLLDVHQQPVPAGVIGEIHVGGCGLARGYLERPALTAERFLPDPFSGRPGARLYRTGDLARLRPDGELDFLGRTDHQVKIRGFRIELGEVEAALLAQPEVHEAVAVAHSQDGPTQTLVAYVSGSADLSEDALRQSLAARLPMYMVPSVLVVLDALPLTPNGKVDRKALPPPGAQRQAAVVAPRTATEHALAPIWEALLGLDAVGVEDNFFHLGGHSLLATQLRARIRQRFAVELPLRRLFEHPTLARQALLIDAGQVEPTSADLPLRQVSRACHPPMSYAQLRLWFLERLEPGRGLYNIPLALHLRGSLDDDALSRAIDASIARHEVLRTRFVESAGEPKQVIDQALHLPLLRTDLADLPAPARAQTLRKHLGELALQGFDMAAGPLLRADLLRLGPHEHVLALTLHHAIADGWSVNVLLGELAATYTELVGGKPARLPDLPVQYADYAQWQRDWLARGIEERQSAYWRERLAGELPVLQLPTDFPRPAQPAYRGGVVRSTCPAELVTGLDDLAQQQGLTLFMVLLAGFKLLLARYSGQRDILVGTPVAGRDRVELEGLIGCFVNTLVLRTDLSGQPSVGTLLDRVRETTLGAFANQDLPFERLVDILQPRRAQAHAPLFQVLFALQNMPRRAHSLPELDMQEDETAPVRARFDLSLILIQDDAGLHARAEYDLDLFTAATVRRLLRHWLILLQGMISDPARLIDHIPVLTPAERHCQLAEWGSTSAAHGSALVHELFTARAVACPECVALASADEQVRYRDLEQRANRLANALRTRGVAAETPVAVCMERGPRLVQTLLAVFKAGGVYVPLDPAHPQGRLEYMLKDCGARLIVTERAQRRRLPLGDLPQLDLDELHLDAFPGDRPTGKHNPDQIAYIIYTSGSTGRPKGVAVSHRGLANLALAQIATFAMGPASRTLQMASIGFDASIAEVLTSLLCGGTLITAATAELRQTDQLLALVRRQAVNTATFPPSLMAVLPADALEQLHTVIAAGAALPVPVMRCWAAGRRLFNAYGPTETTVCASIHGPCDASSSTAPIGRPMAGVRVYLLDAWLEPVPVGVCGLLYIGGPGVARGYVGRADLTAAAFIPDPFGSEPGARIYCSGDLARYDTEGRLHFLGRADEQVELRGYRVEPGEIEARLLAHPAVTEAAVVLSMTDDTARLVAYTCGTDETSPAALRAHLREVLPEFMVPSAFVTLDALPQSTNGKIDRRSLASRPVRSAQGPGGIPRDALEYRLSRLWAKVLGVEQVGIHDDFFDLGGHSMLAVSLAARLESELRRTVPLAQVFQHRSVARLAVYLRTDATAADPPPAIIPLTDFGTGPALVWIHPIGGSGFVYAPLAAVLPTDRPSYAVQAPWLDVEDAELPTSMAAIVEHYLDLITRVLGPAPIQVGGWSFGGVVALELARRLDTLGRSAGPPLLLDPSRVDAEARKALTDADATARLSAVVADLVGRGREERGEPVADIKQAYAQVRDAEAIPGDLPLRRFARMVSVYLAHADALGNHELTPYEGPVALALATADAPDGDAAVTEWRAYLPGLGTPLELDTDHFGLFNEPQLGRLAAWLREHLAKPQAPREQPTQVARGTDHPPLPPMYR